MSDIAFRFPEPARRVYFGCTVVAYQPPYPCRAYPWMFKIRTPEGRELTFAGISNRCGTRASALRRGWWRAKWLANGTFDQRYGS